MRDGTYREMFEKFYCKVGIYNILYKQGQHMAILNLTLKLTHIITSKMHS